MGRKEVAIVFLGLLFWRLSSVSGFEEYTKSEVTCRYVSQCVLPRARSEAVQCPHRLLKTQSCHRHLLL